MTQATQPTREKGRDKARRPQRPPIYFRAVRLVDPATGAEVSAFVPNAAGDQAEIKRRGIKIGHVLRGQLTRPRSVPNHNRAHALGDLLRENIDGFDLFGAHEAVKELQRRSGVGCDVMNIEVPGVGTLGVNVPWSIAFDLMEEGEFAKVMNGLHRYIVATYWPDCTPEQIEQMGKLMNREGP